MFSNSGIRYGSTILINFIEIPSESVALDLILAKALLIVVGNIYLKTNLLSLKVSPERWPRANLSSTTASPAKNSFNYSSAD